MEKDRSEIEYPLPSTRQAVIVEKIVICDNARAHFGDIFDATHHRSASMILTSQQSLNRQSCNHRSSWLRTMTAVVVGTWIGNFTVGPLKRALNGLFLAILLYLPLMFRRYQRPVSCMTRLMTGTDWIEPEVDLTLEDLWLLYSLAVAIGVSRETLKKHFARKDQSLQCRLQMNPTIIDRTERYKPDRLLYDYLSSLVIMCLAIQRIMQLAMFVNKLSYNIALILTQVSYCVTTFQLVLMGDCLCHNILRYFVWFPRIQSLPSPMLCSIFSWQHSLVCLLYSSNSRLLRLSYHCTQCTRKSKNWKQSESKRQIDEAIALLLSYIAVSWLCMLMTAADDILVFEVSAESAGHATRQLLDLVILSRLPWCFGVEY